MPAVKPKSVHVAFALSILDDEDAGVEEVEDDALFDDEMLVS